MPKSGVKNFLGFTSQQNHYPGDLYIVKLGLCPSKVLVQAGFALMGMSSSYVVVISALVSKCHTETIYYETFFLKIRNSTFL